MKLKTVELSDSALQGIGFVVTPRQRPKVAAGTDFLYADTKSDLGLEGPLSSGSLECASRPMTLGRMERHLKTREMLVALDGDAVVCCAPPQEPSRKGLQGVAAVKVRSGEAFVLETGAWHWIPFPHGSPTARFLVVFRSATGANDLYFCDFDEPYSVSE